MQTQINDGSSKFNFYRNDSKSLVFLDNSETVNKNENNISSSLFGNNKNLV